MEGLLEDGFCLQEKLGASFRRAAERALNGYVSDHALLSLAKLSHSP